MCVRMCVNAYNRARTRKREREREGGRISVLFGSKGQKLEGRACRAQCAIWQLPRISTPLWPPLYLFPSSTLTHQRILHLPSTFFHPYPPSSRSCFVSSFPGCMQKRCGRKQRERQRGTRKADEWRHILLKTKRRGWKQVVRECTVLSSSSSFFFYPFLFSFLFSPLFFRFTSRQKYFCFLLFSAILLHLSSAFSLQPSPNERRKNDNILLPSRRSSPPRAFGFLHRVLFAF